MGWPEKLRAMIKSQARFAARAKKRAQEYDSEEMALVDEECAAVSQLASSISHNDMPQRTATLQVSFFFLVLFILSENTDAIFTWNRADWISQL